MVVGMILDRKGGAVVTVERNAQLREAVSLLAVRRIGALPVVEKGRVVGVISERDVIYCLESEGGAALDKIVGEVMTAPAVTVTPDAPILAALAQMSQRRIRHLPVVTENRLVGIVSIGDLVQHRIERIEEEASAMRAYIQSA
ncbi:CBS domain-containing protein [Allosphingosinicella flava]|uniref:CBS domain-containing protein n=1 Tax=Allosphingosinicella flava TaxID=2771430 RepID=A0A7T2GJ14_9SPHN|nr:CBS domain-containing protein [Sphingosinicella flava]QPQ54755.1 CBS domain-containing protein [Sphingosinicella flava]